MSTWGKGPFQNDAAADSADEIIHMIIEHIETALASRTVSLTCLISLHAPLAILGIALKESGSACLHWEQVLKWKDQADGLFAQNKDQELARKHKSEIMKTLRKLLRMTG